MIEGLLCHYPAAVAAIQGFFCFFLSKRVFGQRIDFKRNWYIPVFLMVGCSMISHFIAHAIGEPFMTITGVLMVSVILCLHVKTKLILMMYVVFTVFLFNIALLMAELPIAGMVVYLVAGHNNDAADLAALPILVITNIIICNIKIVKNGLVFLFEKDNSFKQPLVILFSTVLMLCIAVHELFKSGMDTTEYRSVYLSIAAFFAAVVGFFFRYLYMALKENSEKRELEQLNKALVSEKHDVEEWVKNLKKEMQDISPEISAEIAGELEDLIPPKCDWHSKLGIPSTGMASIDVYLLGCRDNGVRYGVDVTILVRERLNCIMGKRVGSASMLSVISNYVSNAFTALAETERENKQILIEFGMNCDTDAYEIIIYDNAHEFDADVIKNLGKENNTTNGTGRGFPNTMKSLATLGASLTVREWEYDDAKNVPTKCIVIRFDEKGESCVESYRFGRFEIEREEDFLPVPKFKSNKKQETKV